MIAGYFAWPYEIAFAEALSSLGHEVTRFSFQDFLGGRLSRVEMAMPFPGPGLLRLNRSLAASAQTCGADVVLVWNGTHVLPRTLRRIRSARSQVVSYNNDDPFNPVAHEDTPWHQRFLWIWYLKALRECDMNFVFRSVNVREATSLGARHVHVLKPYFIPALHHPVHLSAQESNRFDCDAVFAGHYEPDGRVESLRALVAAGVHTRLFGGKYWTSDVLGDLAPYFGNIVPVTGVNYTKALCGAKICLAFLSKRNRDTYTRRCFEIPACGRVLMCERTDDLEAMFVAGREAMFFSSAHELVEKTTWLLANPTERERIAEAGKQRVWASGHDVLSRAREFMSYLTGAET